MSDGTDVYGGYEQPSFDNDYLSRLDIDTDQLDDVLQDIDDQVDEYDADVTLQIAERSYTDAYWETDIDRDTDHDFFTVYLSEDAETLQEEMPDSVFGRLDPDDEVHDFYVDDVVLRLITGHDHDVIELMDTDYDAIDIGRPTEESLYTEWARQQE